MNEQRIVEIVEEVLEKKFVNGIDEAIKQAVYKLPIGELIDKFIVTHARLWNLEDLITTGENDKAVAEASRRLREVNSERARIREELNRRLDGVGVGSEKIYMKRMDVFDDDEKDSTEQESS